jgi:two-component system sensor histidine kinase AgrC
MRTFATYLAFVIALVLILELKPVRAVVSTAIYTIILSGGYFASDKILVDIYGYSREIIKSDILVSLVSDIIKFGLVIIVFILIRLFRQANELNDRNRMNIGLKTSLFILATLVVIAINCFVYLKYIGFVERGVILASVAILWLYLILSLYINFSASALALKEQEYDQQQDYIRTIESLINDFRRLKHSYSNTIYSFYGYIEEKDLEGLTAYYSDVVDEIRRLDSNLLLTLQKIKIYAVFGLLWSKINEAQDKGVEVGVQVANEIHNAGMRLTDLCEVLGNFLDNAIDAAAASTLKKMNISLTDRDGFLNIKIENTYEGVLDIKRLQRSGFSTKGDSHGFGLAITKKILARYSNVLLNTIAEDGRFRQELVIKK